MKPSAFTYHRPSSLEEALALLEQWGPQAKLLAGGQSLVPMLNMRLANPAHLVDVGDLTEFARIRDAGDQVEIGALVRHHQVAGSPLLRARCPLLAQAAATIGHYAIRQRGTFGGSLAHADPAAQMVLAALALDARLTLVRRGGQRELPASDFFQAAMTTALAPQEMLLSVRLPTIAAREGCAFRMFNRRHGDFAVVSVAATLAVEAGCVTRVRLAVGGVSPVPQRFDAVTGRFLGERASAGWAAALGDAVAAAVEPMDDARIPAAYRRDLARTLVREALERAMQPLLEAGA